MKDDFTTSRSLVSLDGSTEQSRSSKRKSMTNDATYSRSLVSLKDEESERSETNQPARRRSMPTIVSDADPTMSSEWVLAQISQQEDETFSELSEELSGEPPEKPANTAQAPKPRSDGKPGGAANSALLSGVRVQSKSGYGTFTVATPNKSTTTTMATTTTTNHHNHHNHHNHQTRQHPCVLKAHHPQSA